MRKIARKFPDIIINHKEKKSCYAYTPGCNEIRLGLSPDKGESRVVNSLIHEITHWAEYMFLEYDEMKLVDMSYRDFLEKDKLSDVGRCKPPPMHIIEKVAYYISDDYWFD